MQYSQFLNNVVLFYLPLIKKPMKKDFPKEVRLNQSINYFYTGKQTFYNLM